MVTSSFQSPTVESEDDCVTYWIRILCAMILERQKRLLALIDALGGEIGNLDFQKLLFLYCREVETESVYEFVPYKFGGFSFTSYADKRRLTKQGLLAEEERIWKLTPEGRIHAKVPAMVRVGMDSFARRRANLRGDVLVTEAYRLHPYYATRSEIAVRLLAGDAEARAAIDAARPSPGQPGLCTIGYEGRTLEGYLNCLLLDGVTLLCDVRRNPISRKYGFSKNTLAKGCEGVGVQYEHLGELGIASEERRDLHTQADYDALFAVYARDSLPLKGPALAKIRGWVEDGHRVALTCFETQACQCHRQSVAEALEREFGETFSPRHL